MEEIPLVDRTGGSVVWSYVLAVIGIGGLWLAGMKSSVGWLIGFFSQILWIVYAIQSKQYGFILSAVGYGFVYARNWWRWTFKEPAE